MSGRFNGAFLGRLNKKVFYFSALAMVAVVAAGLFISFDNPITVSAQRGDDTRRASRDTKVARADMLGIALDLRSAGDHTVFAQKGIRGDGVANLRGKSGTGSDEASLGENGSGLKARSDFTKSFSAINQLPCEELDGELTGGSFKPGVYCAPSATLSQQMILDAGGDSNGIFIFRTSGSIKTAEGFQMTLENGTTPGNVFFVSGDTASIADFGSISGSVIARNTITVGKGATVNGRALSKDGEVVLGESSNLVLQEGVIEICKEAVAPVVSTPPITLHGTSEAGEAGLAMVQGPSGLENRIFQFRLNGQIYQVPVGGCSGPITVPAGPTLIEELIDGTFTNQAGTWNNRFRLVRVERSGPSTLGAINLPLRTAVVNVVQGTISSQTVVTFFNQFAIPAVIEICKRAVAGDPDVAGFFDFTVDALPNQIFPVPVGQCSGAIQVQPVANPAAPPASGTIRVTELTETGFNLDSASTFPASRFIALNLGQRIVNNIACSTIGSGPVPPECVASNPGGGFVTATVIEGGTEGQTTINFFNRTAPGVVKVCKIAGPGIPQGTRFEFLVQGTVAGPTQPFAPGTVETRTVVVAAGPASQGGFCDFVRNADGSLTLFVVGTNVYVDEIGAIDPIPGVPPGEIRVSRIRLNQSLTGFVSAPATVPATSVGVVPAAPARSVNPNPNLLTAEAVFQQRRGTREIEYVNFVFRPTTLKICKIAGPNINLGTPFTFAITIDNVSGLIPGQTNQPITVPNLVVAAGPASSGGFCAFAEGPYTPTATNPPVGTFPVGAIVSVTELPSPDTLVTDITSPTGTVEVCSPANPRCGRLTLGFAGGFNELVFTNRGTPPGDPSGLPRELTGSTDSACPGVEDSAQVSVFLAAQGDEISANFTVQFDQTRLGDPEVQIGAGALADGFVLNVDYSNVASGQIGISLTSPGNTPFTAGSRELISIEFDTLNLSTGEALITFGGPTQTVTTDQLNEVPTEPGQASVTIGGPTVPGCATSSGVTVSGRVLSQEGNGVRNATVTITDQLGSRRTVTTNSLGYYQIEDVKAGDVYVVNASSRRYRFAAKAMQITDDLANLDFVGME